MAKLKSEQEAIDYMLASTSVQDWNTRRELVRETFGNTFITTKVDAALLIKDAKFRVDRYK
jgi:hypothetical protein